VDIISEEEEITDTVCEQGAVDSPSGLAFRRRFIDRHFSANI